MDGDKVDASLLHKRVDKWVADAGLEEAKTKGLRFHDSIHVLTRDYLGRSSEYIRKFGRSQGKGPSVLEEMIVSVVQIAANAKRREEDYKNLVSFYIKGGGLRGIAETLLEGYHKPESLEYLSKDKIVSRSIKIVQALMGRGDFDKFLDTINAYYAKLD